MTDHERNRVLWADHLGLARGRYLPAGAPRSAVVTFVLGYDRVINEVSVGIDRTGYPDVDTELDLAHARRGWDAGTDPDGPIDDLMVTADASGLPIESLNTEFDFPQFEMKLAHRDAPDAVDDIVLLEELARRSPTSGACR